jgi:hypothetical protein
VTAEAAYESWRTERKELEPGNYGERFSFFNLMGYPGTVVRSWDDIAFDDNAVLFYHRNPEPKLTREVLIARQGLEAEVDRIADNL